MKIKASYHCGQSWLSNLIHVNSYNIKQSLGLWDLMAMKDCSTCKKAAASANHNLRDSADSFLSGGVDCYLSSLLGPQSVDSKNNIEKHLKT